MSGHGGGGGYPTINRPTDNDSCENLVLITNVASPRADVLSSLNIGDILDVTIVSDQGPIQFLDVDGNIVGNLVSREQVRLLQCIIGGTSFVAEILQLDKGQCNVKIYAE